MKFTPTEDQRMIADSFAGVLQNVDRDDWAALKDLGLTHATWPEAAGGADMTLAEMVPALIETGRAASATPVISCGILPGLAMERAGATLPDMADAQICSIADVSGLRGDAGGLSGSLPVVPGADAAEHFLLCLPDGYLGIFTAEQGAVQPCQLLDGRGAAHVQPAQLRKLHTVQGPDDLTDWLQDAAATAFAADALGAMFALRDMTLDYLKQRKQFGRPLGAFQALQHAMVDIHHETEHFHSLVLLAAIACTGEDEALRMRAVSAMKRFLGTRIRKAAASAIQLHGGIGMTEEYPLGRYVKRVLVADMLMGSADFHGKRLSRQIADESRTPPLQKETAA